MKGRQMKEKGISIKVRLDTLVSVYTASSSFNRYQKRFVATQVDPSLGRAIQAGLPCRIHWKTIVRKVMKW